MGVAESITAWGIQRGAEVAELAAAAGLDVAIAATLMDKESDGRNVWGSDPVSTGGAYVKGSAVTRADYEAYRALANAGKIGRQGVGPGQLTWSGYQAEADRRGGCWDWRVNARYSFEILRDLQAQHGTRNGFRAYNGSGPAAERYADDAMAKLARWRTRLGPTTTPTPAPRPSAPTSEEDELTPDEKALLARVPALEQKIDLLLTQLVYGQADAKDGRWGWNTWGGGTDERLTALDLLRRSNVEVRQLHHNATALHGKVDAIATSTAAEVSGVAKQIGELAAEVRSLAAGGVALDPATAPLIELGEIQLVGTLRPRAA